jgi:Mce-associated membrane protein
VWKWVAAGVTVLVTVGLLAVSGVMMYHHKQLQDDQRRAAEFAAAARQGVVTLMSLDHTHAKEDVQRIVDISTGDFKTDFEATADDFAKVAEQAKVTTQAQVNATAVNSMTDDSAVVLVAATSTITNAAGANQDPRNWRLSVTVKRDGDQIKLAKVEFVP